MGSSVRPKYYFANVQLGETSDFIRLPAESTGSVCVLLQSSARSQWQLCGSWNGDPASMNFTSYMLQDLERSLADGKGMTAVISNEGVLILLPSVYLQGLEK